MSNNSDYTKKSTNFFDMLPARHRTNFNRSLFENTFNRALTKTELTHAVGNIGQAPSSQLPEDSPHRQAFQLQPLASAVVATANYNLSFADFIKELSVLGVDPSTFYQWGSTETFNYAPPIDVDKLVNYIDYFWVDKDSVSPPQYITIRNLDRVIRSQLFQKSAEIKQVSPKDIVDISGSPLAFVIDGDYTSVFVPFAPFGVTNTPPNNSNCWVVSESYLQDDKTYIVPTQPITDTTTLGKIDLNIQETILENMLRVYGYNTTAIVSYNIDSILDIINERASILTANNISINSCSITDPYLYALMHTYTGITDVGLVEAQLYWEDNKYLFSNPWSLDNKWIHRLDLSVDNQAVAIQAVMPIIEYSSTLELNEWTYTIHQWRHRLTPTSPWVITTEQPTYNQMTASNFKKLWRYDGIVDVVPVSKPELIEILAIADSNTTSLVTIDGGTFTITTPVNRVLTGFNDICVYINGKRQYSNYTELYNGNNYVTGIKFLEPLLPYQWDKVTITIGAQTTTDLNRDSVEVKLVDKTIATVSLIQYRKAEQVKEPGKIQYPLFNLYNVDGTHSGTVSSLFSFKEDTSYPTNSILSKRIVVDNGIYTYTQHLTDANNKQLTAYRDHSAISSLNEQGFETIWRTSTLPVTYVPSRVDGDRTPVTYPNGDWEIPVQWFYNASHENKKDITSVQLSAHFGSIGLNQVIPPSFFTNKDTACRLQFNIDYGIGGTIKEHNNSFDLTVSSIITTANTPITVLEFAETQYKMALNVIKSLTEDHAVSILLQTDDSHITNLESAFIEDVISAYEANLYTKQIFGDSTMYDSTTNTGMKNWIQTLPGARLVNAQMPVILKDDSRDIYQLRHHDGHLSNVYIDQATIVDIKTKLINTVLASSPARKRGWTATIAADYGTPISTYLAIPYTRLLKNDYWLDTNKDLYRLELIAIQSTPPNAATYPSAYYMNSVTGDVYVSDGSSWIIDTIANAWVLVDIVELYAATLLDIETKLYEVSAENNKQWNWDPSTLVLLSGEEQAFLTYAKENGVINPYTSDYTIADPFTWNYSSVTPQYFPYDDDLVNARWAARWHTIYQNIFNTPYPHLEPWKLQGYTSKPTWWDDQYKDISNTRRWTLSMWNKIKQGKVPAGKALPNGTISTNSNLVQPSLPVYSFVCVNITATTYSGYAPDDLLPPYVSDINLQGYTFVVDQSQINAGDVSEGYEFGDQGPLEWTWRNSASYLYTTAKLGFKDQPITFMHYNWGYDYHIVGNLNIEQISKTVASHVTGTFHGDVVNDVVQTYKGLNQWYVNLNRYQSNDSKASDFTQIWNNWSMKYAYQTDSFVDSKSLVIQTKNFIVDEPERKVIVKKTPDVTEHWADALKITTAQYGNTKTINGTRVPRGDGSDWVFTIDNFTNTSRTIQYYGVKDFDFTVVTPETGTMQTTTNHTFDTGDQIALYSTMKLPSPLQYYQQYFFIKLTSNTFRLADSYEDAIAGTYIILDNFEQSSIHKIHTYYTDFYAYGGAHTPTTWYHNTIDRDVVVTASFPFQVTGIQNVIDIIDGYASWLKDDGFMFNHTDYIETDYNTGQTLSWQSEEERFINTVYTGMGSDNTYATQKRTIYEISVDLGLNQIVLTNSNVKFDNGDRVFIQTGSVPPQGLLLNTTYYMIVLDANLGRYRLASSRQNALDNISIFISNIGVGSQFLSAQYPVQFDSIEYAEINPFRNNIWINTPTGIVSDVLKGPYEEITMPYTLYDQYGRTLSSDGIQVYREDNKTRVHSYPNLLNDHIGTVDETGYNNIHIAGWRVFVDNYEHIIQFSNYLIDGTLIYDPYLGLGVKYFNIEMDKQTNKVKRPSVGGFLLYNGELIRNLEGSVEDLANMYSVYDAKESSDLTFYVRNSLGFKNTDNLSFVGPNKKSNFVFWRGAIQQKGAMTAMDAFNNSVDYIETNLDEVWAYKQATFGNVTQEQYPRIKMKVGDEFRLDYRYELNYKTDNLYQSYFNPIHFYDITRWNNLPDIQPNQPAIDTIRLETNVHSIQELEVDINQYVTLNAFCDNVDIFDNGTKLVEGTNYRFITNRLIQFLTAHSVVKIYNLIPSRSKHSPMYIQDTLAHTINERPFLWDPAREFDYHTPFVHVDIKSDNNPNKQIFETVVSAGKDITFEYSSFEKSDIVVTTLEIGPKLKTSSMVFINGTIMKQGAGFDYTISGNNIIWSNDIVSNLLTDDTILVIHVRGKGNVAIESIDLSTNIDENNKSTFSNNMVYVPYTNSLFVMLNGSVLVPEEDYLEEDQVSIKWNVLPQPTDESFAIVVNSIFDKHVYTNENIDAITNEIVFDFYHTTYNYLVILNGKVLAPDIDFIPTSVGIQLLNLTDRIGPNTLVVLVNRLIDAVEVHTQEWTTDKVGTIWWNTNNLNYKLYHDKKFFSSTEEQLVNWGALGTDAEIEILEWTKSSVPPSEYAAAATKQEGDYSIPVNDRASGTVRKFAKYKGEFFDERKFKIEFYRATVGNFFDEIIYPLTGIKKKLFHPDANVIVYVNNNSRSWMKLRNFNIDDYSIYDFVRIEIDIHEIVFPRVVTLVGSDKTVDSDTGLSPTTLYSFQINYNNTILTFTFKRKENDPEIITYQYLIDYLNSFMPTYLEVAMTETGDISINGIKSTPDTSIAIVRDNLFNKLAGFTTTEALEPFNLSSKYLQDFTEDYDYITETKVSGTTEYNEYYFWVANKKIAQQDRKMSLSQMQTLLAYPDVAYFVLKDYIKTVSDKELLNNRYQSLIVRNLQHKLVVDNRNVLIVTQNNTLRDITSQDIDSTRKNQHEEWVLFRKNSTSLIPSVLWEKLTETVVGYQVIGTSANVNYPIPSLDRVLFDQTNGTTIRYGLQTNQAFGDKEQLLNTIQSYILRDDVDISPINKLTFLNSISFDDPESIISFMDQIYNMLPVSTVNAIFFECMMDAITIQPIVTDLIKTSYVSLYTIKSLVVED